MVDEEEDEVVMRIPVRIRKTRDDAPLYLFQYPLRPHWRPYDTGSLQEARVRPQHQQVELKLGTDSGSAHYDEDSPSPLTNITLTSTLTMPKTSYAIGMLTSAGEEGEEEGDGVSLTLAPLECCLQLRPCFSEIDEIEAQANQPASRDASGPEAAEAAAPSTFAPVFRPAQTEKEIEARRNSHACAACPARTSHAAVRAHAKRRVVLRHGETSPKLTRA